VGLRALKGELCVVTLAERGAELLARRGQIGASRGGPLAVELDRVRGWRK
jgi:hypothetical protein